MLMISIWRDSGSANSADADYEVAFNGAPVPIGQEAAAAPWVTLLRRCSGPTRHQARISGPASTPGVYSARTQRQAARPGSAARASGARAGSKARRVRGELCAPPTGAPKLGQVAQARVRDRHGTLPELRRRTEDHCGDPRTARHREDPHALGSAGACTASCAGSRPGAASGLTLPNLDGSCDPAPRDAGFGCVRGFAGPMEAGWRPGITRRRRPRKTIFGSAIKAQPSCATFKDRHTRVDSRVRGAMGKEKRAFENPILKILSSARSARSIGGSFIASASTISMGVGMAGSLTRWNNV